MSNFNELHKQLRNLSTMLNSPTMQAARKMTKDFYNSPVMQASIKLNQAFYSSPTMKIAMKMSETYKQFALLQNTFKNNPILHSDVQNSLNLAQQLREQYKSLEMYVMPLATGAIHIHNQLEASNYLDEIISTVDWEALEADTTDPEIPSILEEDTILEELSSTSDTDSAAEEKTEINYITLVSLISSLLNICNYIGKFITYIYDPETKQKAVALYIFFKEHAKILMDQLPLD